MSGAVAVAVVGSNHKPLGARTPGGFVLAPDDIGRAQRPSWPASDGSAVTGSASMPGRIMNRSLP